MRRRGGGACSFPETKKGDKAKEDEHMGRIDEEKIQGKKQERRTEARKYMSRYEERRQQRGRWEV